MSSVSQNANMQNTEGKLVVYKCHCICQVHRIKNPNAEGYTANDVQHSQGFFAFTSSTKHETPVGNNGYHGDDC